MDALFSYIYHLCLVQKGTVRGKLASMHMEWKILGVSGKKATTVTFVPAAVWIGVTCVCI
jgi:hypothetical protein